MDKSKVEFEKWYFEDLKVVADYDLSWQAWQASRKALVVELPFGEHDTFEQDVDALKRRLSDAGIAYK